MSLTLAVQKAVVTALSGDLNADVYGTPPDNAAMPYVDMTLQAVPDAVMHRQRDTVTVFLNVWTDGPGNTEAEQILENIRTTLDTAKLSLDTGEMVRAYLTQRSTEPDINQRTHIGRATLRVIATR